MPEAGVSEGFLDGWIGGWVHGMMQEDVKALGQGDNWPNMLPWTIHFAYDQFSSSVENNYLGERIK